MKASTRATLLRLLLIINVIKPVSAQPAAAQEQPLTLAEAWQKAEASNKTVQQGALAVAASEQRVRDAKAERLPDINAGTEYARISSFPVYENGLFNEPTNLPILHNSFQLETEAYLNLYNGHKLRTRIESEEVAHRLVTEQKAQATSDVKLRVTAVFLDLQRNRIFRDLIHQDIQEARKRLDQIRELHKNGVVLRSDLLRAELQLSRQQMKQVEIKNNINLANQKLDLLIGLPDTTRIRPSDELQTVPLAGTYTDYLADAYDGSHALKLASQQTQRRELQSKEVQANRQPKVGLFARYQYAYPQILFYPYAPSLYGFGQAGLKISYPISSLYHNKHKEQAARMDLQRQQVAQTEVKDEVKQAVNEAYTRYQESLQRIDVAQLNIKQAAENYRIVNNSYFNQLALLTDLLDADNQQLQAQFDLASARLTSQLHYYQLLNATGKL
ncbi:TolC family protein [Larkinella insperata]|uniref:TolC family protein n=1 Tax=Larkinella insperata TaxID=332158 RepID=A0ABW3Q4Y0_9BACT|nr:TolC family protein [Larkinella insperata]